jgi:TRAP transporter TAXI family solute receptor
LKGKRVSLGAEQSGVAVTAAVILKAAGLTFGDLARVDHASYVAAARMVEQGELDASFYGPAGLGFELVRHILASGKTKLVPIPPEVVAKVGNPAYVAGTIPAGSYDGQPAAVPTAVIMTLLVTREAVSNDVVYLMTRSLFDYLDLLVQTHPAAKDIDVAKAPFGLPAPLHPGAERYYREIGLMK